MTSRSLVFITLILVAAWSPWWFVGALLVGAFLYYQDFFEGIIILFYLDLIYSTGLGGWRSYFICTIVGVLFLLIVELCRKAMLMRD